MSFHKVPPRSCVILKKTLPRFQVTLISVTLLFSFPPFLLNVRILNSGMMDEWRKEGRGEWAHDSIREAVMQV